MATTPSEATCPVCNKDIPFQNINSHIDNCLANSDKDKLLKTKEDLPTKSTSKRKRDESSPEEQPKKKSWSFLIKSPASATKTQADKRTSKLTVSKLGGSSTSSHKDESTKTADPSSSAGTAKTEVNNSKPTYGMFSKEKAKPDFRPLPERMRPKILDDYIGQNKAVGRNSMLRRLLESDEVPSMILWGPPGCGKTTLASIISQRAKQNGSARFVTLSATTSNVAQVKEVITQAKNEQKMFKRKTILFVDEIHRFNKLQQDSFLPHVENGSIILIGATTENPSFKVNSALLSRCRVVVLDKLSMEDLTKIIERTLSELGVKILEKEDSSCSDSEDGEGEENGCKKSAVYMERHAITTLANLCDGDARAALNALQMTIQSQSSTQNNNALSSNNHSDRLNGDTSGDDEPINKHHVIKVCHVKEGLQRSHILYDRTGEEHYNCISALHKSMRGCDANAALYWMSRMLLGGEDPLYIARRLIEFASADIGLADPQALVQAVSTFKACEVVGMPVCQINLTQCVIYLSRAPKNPMVELVMQNVKRCLEEHEGPMPGVPLYLRNASTPLMRQLGYGKGYDPSSRTQQYMPEGMEDEDFFKGIDKMFL